jgi:hypothetical protein
MVRLSLMGSLRYGRSIRTFSSFGFYYYVTVSMKVYYKILMGNGLFVMMGFMIATAKTSTSGSVGLNMAAKLSAKAGEILADVAMSSSLEVEDGDEEVLQNAYRSGWVIETTLAEVKSKLDAARSTPSTEDDVEAMRLAHRGSYRLFLENN